MIATLNQIPLPPVVFLQPFFVDVFSRVLTPSHDFSLLADHFLHVRGTGMIQIPFSI